MHKKWYTQKQSLNVKFLSILGNNEIYKKKLKRGYLARYLWSLSLL